MSPYQCGCDPYSQECPCCTGELLGDPLPPEPEEAEA